MTSGRLRAHGATALLFLAVFGAAALVGLVPYRLEVRATRYELQRKVLAVGRLKAREVEHWLEERRQDAAGAAQGPRIALDVERWQATGAIDPARREWIRGRLRRLRELGDYAEVVIVGRDGRPLIAAVDLATGGSDLGSDLALRAARDRKVLISDLQRVRVGPTDVVMDVFAPLEAVDDAGGRVVGTLVYRIDPRRYLFPLIRWWPTDSRSAETLLVERDGDSVLFLNDLRFREGTALRLRAPLDARDRVAAKAIRGERGVVEGLDYRGVPTLTWVGEVAGTPWLLVSKIDQAEVYAPLGDFAWTYAVFLLAAALSAVALAGFRVRGLREVTLRADHDATRRHVAALEAARAERESLIGRLQKALDDVKTLRGIVPICASCKRIRDDEGYWRQVESYVSAHTEAQFSHGVCPECAKRLYGDLAAAPTPEPGKR